MAMLVDTNAVRALGSDCRASADELSTATAALARVPEPAAAAALGAVGERFLAALADAVGEQARAIALLGEDLASAHSASGAVAGAYAEADRHGSHLL